MFVAIMIYYHIHPGWPILMLPVFLLLAVLTALGGGTLVFGAERDLSRRPLRRPVSRTILDVRLARGLSQFARAREMALAVRPESYGRRDRRISVVFSGHRRSARPDAPGVFRGRTSGPGQAG